MRWYGRARQIGHRTGEHAAHVRRHRRLRRCRAAEDRYRDGKRRAGNTGSIVQPSAEGGAIVISATCVAITRLGYAAQPRSCPLRQPIPYLWRIHRVKHERAERTPKLARAQSGRDLVNLSGSAHDEAADSLVQRIAEAGSIGIEAINALCTGIAILDTHGHVLLANAMADAPVRAMRRIQVVDAAPAAASPCAIERRAAQGDRVRRPRELGAAATRRRSASRRQRRRAAVAAVAAVERAGAGPSCCSRWTS